MTFTMRVHDARPRCTSTMHVHDARLRCVSRNARANQRVDKASRSAARRARSTLHHTQRPRADEDWPVADPAGLAIDAVRPIRDDVERRVRALRRELGVTVS